MQGTGYQCVLESSIEVWVPLLTFKNLIDLGQSVKLLCALVFLSVKWECCEDLMCLSHSKWSTNVSCCCLCSSCYFYYWWPGCEPKTDLSGYKAVSFLLYLTAFWQKGWVGSQVIPYCTLSLFSSMCSSTAPDALGHLECCFGNASAQSSGGPFFF